MFRSNSAGEIWTPTIDARTWKLMHYPKCMQPPCSEPTKSEKERAFNPDSAMAYSRVNICYLIVAGNVPMVKRCLEQGADLNADIVGDEFNGVLPLMLAVSIATKAGGHSQETILKQHNMREIIQLLVESGADPNKVLRRNVGRNSRMSDPGDWVINQLLQPLPHQDTSSILAMTDATEKNDHNGLDSILGENLGICIRAQNRGVSPLKLALFRGDIQTITMLLDQGASLDALDPTSTPPIDIAMSFGRPKIIHLLTGRGLDFTASGLSRHPPLECTIWAGDANMCEAILGSQVVQALPYKAEFLTKPLLVAALTCNIKITKLLLDHGADGTMRIPWGEDPNIAGETDTPLGYVEKAIRNSEDVKHYSNTCDRLGICERCNRAWLARRGGVGDAPNWRGLRDVLEEWQERESLVRPGEVPSPYPRTGVAVDMTEEEEAPRPPGVYPY